ncbi:hypothetical protein NP493_221g02032 [Ridgeia piscesae]|uniref:Coiled-coil-helix-coiled-coil-helix domain-containing protein 7 n=1 Tax=Ridgeia piscesae TaxID=27915 RepID=A0AAD9P0D0_RIDPI|nr:hypothetical protein NP493_221g02032 [Ridgeia piscesae]
MEKVVEPAEKQRTSRRKLPRGTRMSDEMKNPCKKESELAMKCMHDSNFTKDDCSLYFQNYRNCMGFWQGISRERRRLGIKPHMPPPEEREQIKREQFDRASAKSR